MRISLSEQTEIEYRVAGFGSRALAYSFDFAIRWTVAVSVVLASIFVLDLIFSAGFSIGKVADFFVNFNRDTGSGKLAIALLVLGIFIIEWGYPIGFEVINNGVTPGKQLFGLRVVDESGLPVDLRSSAMRTIMLLIDLLPGIAAVGFLSMAMTRKYQRLGDLVARTMVIYDEEREYSESRHIRRTGGAAEYRLPLPLFNLIESFVIRWPSLFPESRRLLQIDITAAIRKSAPQIVLGDVEKLSIEEIEKIALSSEPSRAKYESAQRSTKAGEAGEQRRPGGI